MHHIWRTQEQKLVTPTARAEETETHTAQAILLESVVLANSAIIGKQKKLQQFAHLMQLFAHLTQLFAHLTQLFARLTQLFAL